MKRLMRLALIALPCQLAACGGFVPVGKIDLGPVPDGALQECAHPRDFFPDRAMTQAEVEVSISRLGNALIACGLRHDALADYLVGLRADLSLGKKL